MAGHVMRNIYTVTTDNLMFVNYIVYLLSTKYFILNKKKKDLFQNWPFEILIFNQVYYKSVKVTFGCILYNVTDAVLKSKNNIYCNVPG